MKWTKKIDTIHIAGDDGRTLCGKPMLGNNYARDDEYIWLDKEIGKAREECQECNSKEIKTYNLIDENSSMVITISATSEEEAKKEAYENVMQGFKYFRVEELEE